jgi:hypothetical protein
MRSRNHKHYGSKEVDYELSESGKEIRKNVTFPNEIKGKCVHFLMCPPIQNQDKQIRSDPTQQVSTISHTTVS